MSEVIRTLIVDDEPLARDDLRAYLRQEADVEIVGEARNGSEALEQIRSGTLDLVMLDIQMPGLNGFDVLRELPPGDRPVVIFVTAHDQYALQAFEAEAVDYLMKPFDQDRLRHALDRARRWLGQRAGDAVAEDTNGSYLDRFVIKQRGRVTLVPAGEVQWVEASGNYVYLHTAGTRHLLRDTLGRLERELDPRSFVRIHRSTIVHLSAVKELERRGSGDYRVHLSSGHTLTLSRSYRRSFESRVGHSI